MSWTPEQQDELPSVFVCASYVGSNASLSFKFDYFGEHFSISLTIVALNIFLCNRNVSVCKRKSADGVFKAQRGWNKATKQRIVQHRHSTVDVQRNRRVREQYAGVFDCILHE